ncbi:MAG: efflux RND transporter periplasmic adaptor subunit [Propionibacteriales bacterium]|nr:efflux RND transporter periplasmic adaptor subunit [Propionibacteriales bacterium]
MKRLLSRVRPPWHRPRRLVLVLLALVVVSGVAGAWLLLRDDAPAAAASTTATVASQTLKETVTASGTVAAATTAELSFAVSGTVTDVFVEPGDTVRKGQKLAAIDDTVLQAELAAAQSALDAAQTAQSEHLSDGSSDEQVAADEAAVVSAESSLAQAEEAVSDAVLRSTTAGTVTAVGLEVDDTVGSSGGTGGNTDASADAATGTVTVVSTGRFVVEATVASADVEKLTKGLQAEMTVSGIDETVYGTVQEVGLVAETDQNGAAAFPVTVAVTDARDDLFGGTSADLAIVVSQRADVVTVDSRAVQTDGDTTYVDKVTDTTTGDSTRTEIEIGEISGMATEVVSGLVEGDVVVVPGFTGPGGGGGNQDMQEMQELMRERIEQGGQLPPGGFIQGPGGGQ